MFIKKHIVFIFLGVATSNTVATNYNLPFLEAVDQEELIEVYDNEAQTYSDSSYRSPVKEWTFITYMAADNDLAMFAKKNLSQQSHIGSNERVNIVAHLDTRVLGNRKITKRYLVQKDRLVITNPTNQPAMDSGNPETLIDCCRWAIKNYPARNYALILWNHGSGIIDIERPRTINPSELFSFNPSTNLIELDRSIPFLQFIKTTMHEQRGVCFDDTTGHYLTNQGLEHALKVVSKECLGGKKFSIVGFDACLMSMLEVANILKDYTEIIVGSQEVELGTGWPYHLVLDPLTKQKLSPHEFATHIVNVYSSVYSSITNDYTQSALDLSKVGQLEQRLNTISKYLIDCLKAQQGTSVRDAIRASRHKLLCTHFDEPSYIDLHHFLTNLQSNLGRFKLNGKQQIITPLRKEINLALPLIKTVAFSNKVGKNLQKAQGISIFFPERRIHKSYRVTKFAQNNQWVAFLHLYLNM